MRYAVVATLFALATAQTREDIPPCALRCLDHAVKIGSRCSTTDNACICGHMFEIRPLIIGCVPSACDPVTIMYKIAPALQAFCDAQRTDVAAGEEKRVE